MVFCEDRNEALLYVECSAGIAGDMFLAALIDMTGGEDYLRSELGKTGLNNYKLDIFRGKRGGIDGVRFDVLFKEEHVHRHLSDIERIIANSSLSNRVKSESMRIFRLLAEAEGKVHGEPAECVHFHEVGAVDAIIDITGAAIMLEYMGWPRVEFSPLNVGAGTVRCAHGVLPVPAPAAAELLKGFEIYSAGDPMERVTPTGAALVKALSAGTLCGMPRGRMEGSGVGLGSRDGDMPNLLRTFLIKPAEQHLKDRCTELSANIDDMTPQDLSFAMERLFAAGALDVWFEHIQMKKNRPAVKLGCLGEAAAADGLTECIFENTTTLGVRKTCVDRVTLKRRTDTFSTGLGVVRVKSALSDAEIIRRMPEFDDVREIALKSGLSTERVRALLAAENLTPDKMDDEACIHKDAANESADMTGGAISR